MFPCRSLNSKWPLNRGRAPYIVREGGPTGSRGRQGTSGAAEARKVPGGQWIITRWGQPSLHRPWTNYFHHCTSLHSPSGVRAISRSARIQWSAGEEAHNVQKMHKKCAQNVHNGCCCTMAGTHRSRMERFVRAHIVLFSRRRRANSTTLCVYHISITIQLSTL